MKIAILCKLAEFKTPSVSITFLQRKTSPKLKLIIQNLGQAPPPSIDIIFNIHVEFARVKILIQRNRGRERFLSNSGRPSGQTANTGSCVTQHEIPTCKRHGTNYKFWAQAGDERCRKKMARHSGGHIFQFSRQGWEIAQQIS